MEELDKKDMKDLIKNAGVMGPSERFLHNVMDEIRISSIQDKITYQPLISKKGWILVGLTILAVIILVLLMSGDSVSVFDKISSYLPDLSLKTNILKNFEIYDTTVYGILFLTIMFFVQISFIKKKIDMTLSL